MYPGKYATQHPDKAAFIMAEFLGLAYLDIVRAAIIPAVLSYVALFYVVHLEAVKLDIRALEPSELSPFWKTFIGGMHYIIPVLMLLYTLVILRMSAVAAAFITEHLGWRMVYFLMAGLSVLVAGILVMLLSDVRGGMSTRTSPLRAFRLPGVWQLLAVMLVYMTAFYGCFAFFGVGVRTAFDLSAQGSGMFVMAYGVGFGVMGFVLGVISPKITRGYLCLVLIAIATSYATWGLTLQSQISALAGTAIWGMLNQLGLNAMVVSLNRQASDARGAVMGLNSAVTYSAVFAGPMIMGPIYAGFGFAAVAGFGPLGEFDLDHAHGFAL